MKILDYCLKNGGQYEEYWDAYLKENNLCDLADRRDAEDEERRMEG